MKTALRLMIACVFALGIAACDDIIIPDHPGGGGRDSTDTGGGRDTTGGGDKDTTGGGDRDTVFFGGQLVFTGRIVDPMGNPTSAPEGSNIHVAWDMGDGREYVLGQGRIESNRGAMGDFFTVIISADEWPEEALFAPDNTTGIHGIGRVVLSQIDYEDNSIIDIRPGIPPLGGMQSHAIIFNTGREMLTPWTAGWIENFDIGLSLAIPAFNGWIPSDQVIPAPPPQIVVFE